MSPLKVLPTMITLLSLSGGCGTDCPAGSAEDSTGRCVMVGEADAGSMDASALDAGASDASAEDTSAPDVFAADATVPDAGTEDSGSPEDAGTDVPAPVECGDSEVGGDEDCDDGNEVEGDGCENDCTFSCIAAADCGNGNMCDGAEVCVLATHTCAPGTPLNCNDSDVCTDDACIPATGCRNTFIDADGDGYARFPTCSTAGLMGGDCEDTDARAFPGQTTFFEVGYCPGGPPCATVSLRYDFNCDMTAERLHTRTTCAFGGCFGGVLDKVGSATGTPICGEPGDFTDCRDFGGGMCALDFGSTRLTQSCR